MGSVVVNERWSTCASSHSCKGQPRLQDLEQARDRIEIEQIQGLESRELANEIDAGLRVRGRPFIRSQDSFTCEYQIRSATATMSSEIAEIRR